jgi:hypothetical protein
MIKAISIVMSDAYHLDVRSTPFLVSHFLSKSNPHPHPHPHPSSSATSAADFGLKFMRLLDGRAAMRKT